MGGWEIVVFPLASNREPAILRAPACHRSSLGENKAMSSELATVSAETGSKSRWAFGLDWPTTIGLALIHLGMLAAPFFFTWKAVLLSVVLIWATGGVGICLGYHRLLTHHSFKTYRPIRWIIACIGTLAGQGPPITWISTHRKHHRFSDENEDPQIGRAHV